jgi:hypothetical protein
MTTEKIEINSAESLNAFLIKLLSKSPDHMVEIEG